MATQIRDGMRESFGEVFGQLETSTLVDLVDRVRSRDEESIRRAAAAGLVGLAIVDAVHPERERQAWGLVRDVVWEARALALTQSLIADPAQFRFPVNAKTKARFLKRLLDFKDQETRKATSQSTRKSV